MIVTGTIHPSSAQRDALEATFVAYAAACTRAMEIGRAARTASNARIHHLAYHELRERYGLSANLSIRAIARAASALKTTPPTLPPPDRIDYDARVFSLDLDAATASLSTVEGRLRDVPLLLRDDALLRLSGRRLGRVVVRKGTGSSYNVEIHTEPPPVPNGVGARDSSFLAPSR